MTTKTITFGSEKTKKYLDYYPKLNGNYICPRWVIHETPENVYKIRDRPYVKKINKECQPEKDTDENLIKENIIPLYFFSFNFAWIKDLPKDTKVNIKINCELNKKNDDISADIIYYNTDSDRLNSFLFHEDGDTKYRSINNYIKKQYNKLNDDEYKIKSDNKKRTFTLEKTIQISNDHPFTIGLIVKTNNLNNNIPRLNITDFELKYESNDEETVIHLESEFEKDDEEIDEIKIEKEEEEDRKLILYGIYDNLHKLTNKAPIKGIKNKIVALFGLNDGKLKELITSEGGEVKTSNNIINKINKDTSYIITHNKDINNKKIYLDNIELDDALKLAINSEGGIITDELSTKTNIIISDNKDQTLDYLDENDISIDEYSMYDKNEFFNITTISKLIELAKKDKELKKPNNEDKLNQKIKILNSKKNVVYTKDLFNIELSKITKYKTINKRNNGKVIGFKNVGSKAINNIHEYKLSIDNFDLKNKRNDELYFSKDSNNNKYIDFTGYVDLVSLPELDNDGNKITLEPDKILWIIPSKMYDDDDETKSMFKNIVNDGDIIYKSDYYDKLSKNNYMLNFNGNDTIKLFYSNTQIDQFSQGINSHYFYNKCILRKLNNKNGKYYWLPPKDRPCECLTDDELDKKGIMRNCLVKEQTEHFSPITTGNFSSIFLLRVILVILVILLFIKF